jgi:DNA-binding transcriptional ArsR family regulator
MTVSDPQPVFRALADPTRRAILQMLAEEPHSIGDITNAFDVSRPAIAKHLRILEEGGLIEVRPNGRERINYLKPEKLNAAREWLSFFDQFWDDRLAALKEIVEETPHE